MPDWADLSDDERIVCERLMELYAEFAEHMDAQVGRLLDVVEDLGQLENTLVVYMLGDNGAAAEGGLYGSANLVSNMNRVPYSVDDIIGRLDELGGPMTYPHYPVGWALAMNTPYQQSKKYASHYGGTRNGMIVHWPARITQPGVRHQWQHCVDLTPTVLEATGIPAPDVVDGVPQAPMEGSSFADTFADPDAEERHTTQYFEVHGSRGIYDHGWTAVTRHMPMPWTRPYRPAPPFADDVWELYDTTSDWTQAEDVAAKFPEKLEELKAKFLVEASRYQVLPLDDRMQERFDPAAAPRPDLLGERRRITLRPSMRGLREGIAPDVKNTSFAIAAEVTVPEAGADGVLIAQGGRFGGWSLYVKDGRPVYCHNLTGARTWIRGELVIPAGDHVVGLDLTYDGGGVGKGAEVVLSVDGTVCGSGRLERTVGFQFSMDETMDVGRDRGTPVTEEYAALPAANAYRGVLRKIRIDLAERLDGPTPAERRRAVMTAH